MRDRKKRNIMIASLCCLLVFMGIGYALLSQTLNINGTAMLTGEWNIYIDSITLSSKSQTATSVSAEVNEDKTGANFEVELLKPGDYVEYDVVVKNDGSINAVLRELIPTTESNNMDILLTHSIIQGQILKAESETKFTLKVRFDERATQIVEGGQTSFNIQMIYEQYDGDVEGIDPSIVPVTANDCFTVDNNGVITRYDYSCGTYVTVPAVVDGITVTEISNYAFTKWNALVYMNGDNPAVVVARDQDSYPLAYNILKGMGVTDQQMPYVLFVDGDKLPDVSSYTPVPYLVSESGMGQPSAELEYLDLSQVTGLKKIQEKAFGSESIDKSLRYLNLDGVSSAIIEEAAFDYSNLESLTIDADAYSTFNNKMNAQIDTLRIYPGDSTIIPDQNGGYVDYKITVNNLIIEEGITKIGNYAFMGNENTSESYGAWNLKSIELPESLTEIGDGAFKYSTATEVRLPSKLKTIGNNAFYRSKISSVNIPEGLTEIGDSAFYNCELTSLVLPKSVTKIGDAAFFNNKISTLDIKISYSNIESGNGLTIGSYAFEGNQITTLNGSDGSQYQYALLTNIDSIGSQAFQNALLIEGLRINDVGSIGKRAFINNPSLLRVKIESVDTIGDYAFSDINNDTNNLEEAYISNVKSIGSYAFADNNIGPDFGKNYWYITDVENIGSYAFADNPLMGGTAPANSNLSYIYLCTTKSIGRGAFDGASGALHIVVSSQDITYNGITPTLGGTTINDKITYYYSQLGYGMCGHY